MKKKRVLALALTLLLGTLTACGSAPVTPGSSGSGSQGANPGKQVTLTVELSQTNITSFPYLFYQENIDAFEKAYPNIKVELLALPDPQTTVTLQTKLAAGEPADLIFYNKQAAENELSATTNFVDLSGEPWVARMTNPELLKAGDGKQYAFKPNIDIEVMGVVYNKDIFKELNLEVPANYQEFLIVCEAIKKSGITPIYAPYKDAWTYQVWSATAFSSYVAANEPELWAELNAGTKKWSDVPAFGDILQKSLDLYNKGYMQETLLSDEYSGAINAFTSKQYAMMFMGDWFISDLESKGAGINMGIFPIPAFDDAECLMGQTIGGCLFIPKQAKHIEEASLFLDFLSQKEQLDAAQAAKPYMPAFDDAAKPALTPIQQEIYDKYIVTSKAVSDMNSFVTVDTTDLWMYYQEMFAGQKTPQQVLEAWDKTFAELMNAKGAAGF